jgi:arginine decarboxylase
MPQARRLPEELEDLESMLSDIYFCNFSVFQSLPDSWAIGQLFPIMPIHRLEERPTRNAVLADITCDSDGKIDHFVSLRDVKRTLELHELRRARRSITWRPSWWGPTRRPSATCTTCSATPTSCTCACTMRAAGGSRRSSRATPPTRCSSTWNTTSTSCIRRLARDCERAIRDGRMTLTESQALKRFYENELNGYAYLEGE